MAVDSKSILTGAAIFGTILVGIVMAVFVTTNAAGGLAALVPLITVILTLLALINPRAGIFGLAALVIWVDEFKRLAVYYGGAYSTTVMQTLAMPFIVLAALNAGFILNVMFGKVKIDRIGILIYALATAIGGAIFVTMDTSLAERGQRAANIAGYMTLIPICYTYFKSFAEWRSFFSFQVIVALPAAAWAIKQYYFGFDQIEWTYARSGLSKVHYAQMIGFENPRTFGFFGSASGLGCAAIYCSYAWWHGLTVSRRRLAWILIAIILSWVLVISTQRTALFYPLLVLVFALFFRTKLRVMAIYTATLATFVLAVVNSDYLLDKGLNDINKLLPSSSQWSSSVLNVSTYSDRIKGWQRLKRPESWSLLGTGGEKYSGASAGYDVNSSDYNHDVINKVLISHGVIGLLVILIPGIAVLTLLHRTVFNANSIQERNETAFALALSLPWIAISMIAGDNFNTNPINLQIWTSFVGVLIVRQSHFRKKAEERQEKRESLPLSGPIGRPASPAR